MLAAFERRPSRSNCAVVGRPAVDVCRKATRQHQNPDDILALDLRARSLDTRQQRQPLEARRATQPLDDLEGRRPAIEIDYGQLDVLHLHGRGLREDEELDDRRNDQRHARAAVAEHADQLFANDGQQSLQHRLLPSIDALLRACAR